MAYWIKVKPSIPGYYWYRDDPASAPEVMWLDEYGVLSSPGWEGEIVYGEKSIDRISIIYGEFWSERIIPPA
jgi:hypothetical protein